MLLLELDQSAEELVVVCVGDRRRVVHVVAHVVLGDLVAQPFHLARYRLARISLRLRHSGFPSAHVSHVAMSSSPAPARAREWRAIPNSRAGAGAGVLPVTSLDHVLDRKVYPLRLGGLGDPRGGYAEVS